MSNKFNGYLKLFGVFSFGFVMGAIFVFYGFEEKKKELSKVSKAIKQTFDENVYVHHKANLDAQFYVVSEIIEKDQLVIEASELLPKKVKNLESEIHLLKSRCEYKQACIDLVNDYQARVDNLKSHYGINY